MKRTIRTILCAATVVLVSVSCQKSIETANPAEGGENGGEGEGTIEVCVNGLMGEYTQVDQVKAQLVNNVRVSWEGGEIVYVYDGTSCIGSLVASLEGTEDRYAVLSTDDQHKITTPAEGTTMLTLVYSPLLTEAPSVSGSTITISLASQSGEKAPFVAYATLEYKGETTITGTVVPFKFATSVIKANCTGLMANTAISSATLGNVNTACELTLSRTSAPGVAGDANGTITRTGDSYFAADKVNGEGVAVFQIAVPVLNAVEEGGRTLTVAQGTNNFEYENFTKEALPEATSVNTVCQFINPIPAGALAGVFSISDTKTVRFSKGNLQATYNSSSNKYSWSFAANQYDCIGDDAGNTTIDNQTDGAVVDLFGWSTISSPYGISTSISIDSYSGDFIDWGRTIGDGITWRTLTTDEWTYLISKYGDADIRKGKYKSDVTVCTKKCMVLAPDDFKGTIYDSYDSIAWATAEAAGLVCLPTAGFRRKSDVNNNGESGYYWSSSKFAVDMARFVFIHGDDVLPHDNEYRYNGFSVRLITETKE